MKTVTDFDLHANSYDCELGEALALFGEDCMAECGFDEDAEKITPIKARAMPRSSGFAILLADFAFVFPRVLSVFQPLEKLACHLPIGAQYQVLCQKPLE